MSQITRDDRRRIIFASVVGTTIELYDFDIFAAAAASVYPLLFFPPEAAAATVATAIILLWSSKPANMVISTPIRSLCLGIGLASAKQPSVRYSRLN